MTSALAQARSRRPGLDCPHHAPRRFGGCGCREKWENVDRLGTTPPAIGWKCRPIGRLTSAIILPVFIAYEPDTSGLIVDSMWMPMYESIQRSKNHNKSL